MKRFGIRSFAEILVGGILLLTAITLTARYHILKREYESYRSGIFARGYESSIAVLSAYLKTSDASLSSKAATDLYELPLSGEEIETVRKLVTDMAAGAYDPEAAARAAAYSEALLSWLSKSRSRAYESGWRGDGMGFPAYGAAPPPDEGGAVPRDDGAVSPAAAKPLPREPEAESRDLLAEKAALLLGRGAIAYRREENGIALYGFRTASSFAEFREDGALYRYLALRREEDVFPTEEEALTAADAFCAAWSEKPAERGEVSRSAGWIRVDYRLGDETLFVTVERGKITAFRRERRD